MLPFLKKRNQTGVIVQQRNPSGSLVDAYNDEGDAPDEMEACAQDILEAIAAKDVKSLAAALKAAMELHQAAPEMENQESE